MTRRLTVSEVVEELEDSDFENEEGDDSSDDDFDGYVDDREMLERDDELHGCDEMSVEEGVGEESGARLRIERARGEEERHEQTQDSGHEEMYGTSVEVSTNSVGEECGEEEEWHEQTQDSGHDEEMQTGAPSIPEYNLEPGCTPNCGDNPVDYFGLLIDDDMLQDIVDQTNLSADQYLASHDLAPHSRIGRWRKSRHDISELKRFLVLVLIMGLIRVPQIENHWCVSWPYSSPAFSSVSEYEKKVVVNSMYSIM